MTEPRRRPSATVRFYTGFIIVLAVAVAIVFLIGYRAGAARPVARTAVRHDDLAAYAQCLRAAKTATRDTVSRASDAPAAYAKFVRLLVAAQTCARRSGLPYFAQGDVTDVTGVTVTGDRYDPADPMWKHPSAGAASAPSGLSRP